jgi:hypothetical protein
MAVSSELVSSGSSAESESLFNDFFCFGGSGFTYSISAVFLPHTPLQPLTQLLLANRPAGQQLSSG